MTLLRNSTILIFSFVAICGVYFGVNRSLQSKFFILKNVEIVKLNEVPQSAPPLNDLASLNLNGNLTGILIGKVSLLGLDLNLIQSRLMSHQWIQDAKVQKKLPNTLLISIAIREPKAILQSRSGSLSYIDGQGKIFGNIQLTSVADVPILAGLNDSVKILEGLLILKSWENSEANDLATISSIVWEPVRGYRLLVAYPLKSRSTQVRTMVDIGQEVDENMNSKLFRLAQVVRYLTQKSIASRQIWTDGGKKVVVKTVTGS